MASPTRFPKGLATFPPRHMLNAFPIATAPRSIILAEDFVDYISQNWTATTAVAGTASYFPYFGGGVKLATSASGTDTIFINRAGCQMQITPNNQAWFQWAVALPRVVQTPQDTNFYVGWANGSPASATDGIFFTKGSGFNTLNLTIRKNSVSTSINNIGDLGTPSGIYGDTGSSNGTLNATIAGTAFTAVSVATPGGGYAHPPLPLTTATAGGTAGSTPIMLPIGTSSYTTGNPSVPVGTTDLPYGQLYAPYIMAGGSGFSNGSGTNLIDVTPVIDLQMYYDGNGTIYFGINGRQIASIGPDGRTAITAGASVNLQAAGTGPSFASGTTISSSLWPVSLQAGNAMSLLPLVPLTPWVGFTNTTANIRAMYVLNNYNGMERT